MREEAMNGPKGKRVSDLDEKLIDAVCSYASGQNQRVRTERELLDNALTRIKQAFTDASYVHTDQKEKMDHLLQDMTNTYANLKHDAIRLGLTYGKAANLDA